ncbi:MAG TPA: subclass B3 metallo-beta-lactamase [Vicinamibacterales bacterium]
MRRVILASLIALAAAFPPVPLRAQAPSAAAKYDPSWTEPLEPFRLAGPIHYVGTRDLAAYLITTTEGHILIDGAVAEAAPAIEASIRKLGFKPEEIKFLLITQAHFDHVGSLAHMKKISGASVQVMRGDDVIVADGGKSDYLFGKDPKYHFTPVPVDRVLSDGDTVKLGGLTLTARHTPGHTPGATSWVMRIPERGRSYRVVFAASVTVNPGTRLVNRPSYPGIADDYRRSFKLLASLEPDIVLWAHASFFDVESRRRRMYSEGAKAWVDPEGFKQLVAARAQAFEELVAKEQPAK